MSAWDKLTPKDVEETIAAMSAEGPTRPYSEFRADVMRSIETGEPLADIVARAWAKIAASVDTHPEGQDRETGLGS
jgi:hypothetical protein